MVVSSSNLTDISNVNNVEVFSLNEIEYSAEIIYRMTKNLPSGARSRIWSLFRSANEVLMLQPNFLGIGADLNKIIEEFLSKD